MLKLAMYWQFGEWRVKKISYYMHKGHIQEISKKMFCSISASNEILSVEKSVKRFVCQILA